MPVSRVIIFTGGRLGKWALEAIRDTDILIGADSGAWFLVQHGFAPHHAIGDFDSVSGEQLALIRKASRLTDAYDPVDKDYSDTEMAFECALSYEPEEIIIVGALGTRFDHSLANVHLLVKAHRTGAAASILDEYNEIRLVTDKLVIARGPFLHVSLLPLSPTVSGITLEGFQYPLQNATLFMGQSLGISNIMLGETAEITVREGWLLIIQSRD
jgi:thiamine pyrophosphokinase